MMVIKTNIAKAKVWEATRPRETKQNKKKAKERI